jgi:type IV pilus assembly protein PilA
MIQIFKANNNGFTLIEVMVVVAIISILAIITIPNYIEYRQQSFCSAGEKDAYHLSLAVHSYFSIPSHNTLVGLTPAQIGFDSFSGFGTQKNTGTIGGTLDNIIVQVTDGSAKCSGNRPGWSAHIYTKTLK